MNGWKKLELFSTISKKHIESLDQTGLEYNLLKYGIDNNGPCCSDHDLLNAFKDAINSSMNESDLYQAIEHICMEYCSSITANE